MGFLEQCRGACLATVGTRLARARNTATVLRATGARGSARVRHRLRDGTRRRAVRTLAIDDGGLVWPAGANPRSIGAARGRGTGPRAQCTDSASPHRHGQAQFDGPKNQRWTARTGAGSDGLRQHRFLFVAAWPARDLATVPFSVLKSILGQGSPSRHVSQRSPSRSMNFP